jgi:cell fate regulator YaaT (PSP1 superfamily)
MGCTNCSCGSTGSACGSNGGCSTSSCNKLNTYDWLAGIPLPSFEEYKIIEISFKNGSRKDFYKIPDNLHLNMGDHVAVTSSSNGFDIGRVSLLGELVKIRLKKTKKIDEKLLPNVLRLANERDLEKLAEARLAERDVMIRARAIVHELKLDMKIGDVEFQGDKRKITFYYTAEGRIDFRELIRVYAREFKVKIEMRQIGARQESGRELCCSTWLTEFKSVSTVAARYQNLAINQTKLSGQCGRLKCCLNYELDTYAEALQDFPKQADTITSKKGTANLLKTDIFKRLMFYIYKSDNGSTEIFPLKVSRVKELLRLASKGTPADDFKTRMDFTAANPEQTKDYDFADVTGIINLSELDEQKRKGRPKRRNRSRNNRKDRNDKAPNQPKAKEDKAPQKNAPKKQTNQAPKKQGNDNNTPAQTPKKEQIKSTRNAPNRRRRAPNNKTTKPENKEQNTAQNKKSNNSKEQEKNTRKKTTDSKEQEKAPRKNNRRNNNRRKRGPKTPKDNNDKTS